LLSSVAAAQTADDTNSRARDHFRHGVSAVEKGDLDLALRDFEAAYAARPHFSVLYNIGQARLGLGQALEAIAAFEGYLREGGAQLSAERKDHVQRLLTEVRRRLGSLRLLPADPERMRVWLDGVEVPREGWRQPLEVVAGEHRVLYSHAGGPPVAQTVSVLRGQSTDVPLAAGRTSSEPTWLSITCMVPGVRVEVPGHAAVTTPLAQPLRLPSGKTAIRFFRSGYRTSEQVLDLTAGRITYADCRLQPERDLSAAHRSNLVVLAQPSDAEIRVDGQVYEGAALPAGPHTLTVERDGFLPKTRSIALSAGRTLRLELELVPTPAARTRLQRARASRKVAGTTLTSVGAALLLGAGGLFLWNNQRYRDWEARQASDSTARTIDSAVTLQRVDDLSIGVTLLGALSGAAGVWFLTTPAGDLP